MSTVIAFTYLPQLIGRSCSHPELLELIRSRGLEWMYKRSSDVPLAGRLSNRSEDLVPDVLNASLDYYAVCEFLLYPIKILFWVTSAIRP